MDFLIEKLRICAHLVVGILIGLYIGAVSQALMETLCSRLRIVSADLAIGVN